MIEKILERLEEAKKVHLNDEEHCLKLGKIIASSFCSAKARAIDGAIEIVQEVAKEYGKDTNVRSNADRIRSMSDEELAEFLKKFDLCTNCKYGEDVRCTFENPCTHGFATAMAYEWLKSEAKE